MNLAVELNDQDLERDNCPIKKDIDKFKSNDLVLAVVAQVGAGPSYVARIVNDLLAAKKITSKIIKFSDLIREVIASTDINIGGLDKYPRGRVDTTTTYQNAGDSLRERFGSDIMASLAISKMSSFRNGEEDDRNGMAFILDSIKHPDEVDLLRAVYGKSFYLISVVCSFDKRFDRLKEKYKSDAASKCLALAERDEVGEYDFGQHVRKTFHLGDFFVSNEMDGSEDLTDHLGRFIEILQGVNYSGPTLDEKGMYAAQSAALGSCCLSRQIGAAILSHEGNVLATGCNDVPKGGGGLYGSDDGRQKDERCWHKGKCANEEQKAEIYSEVIDKLIETKFIQPGAKDEAISALKSTRIKNLIEFSRAVHAEMDAIVSVAREGACSTKNAILYTTTYPCHHCARHIVAAGIKEVVYIEPYPKSLAISLHKDSIAETTRRYELKTDDTRVAFRLFSGVGPRRYRALFERPWDLKGKDGRIIEPDDASTQHRDPILVKSYLDLEKTVAERVAKRIAEAGSNAS